MCKPDIPDPPPPVKIPPPPKVTPTLAIETQVAPVIGDQRSGSRKPKKQGISAMRRNLTIQSDGLGAGLNIPV